jgi:hypothetical protein
MFSIITPLDTNRFEQFKNTKRLYDGMDYEKEFIIPTRKFKSVKGYLMANGLMKDVRLIPYTHSKGFNCSKALNLGVRHAKYDSVIITSPEVKPTTNVLEQLSECIGSNVVCQVADENEDGSIGQILVSRIFRSDNPGMYFLAMFNKKDIESINGWDEEFMKGYAYEDNDFGERWNRAGLPFQIRDDIQAVHQYHPRSETISNGTSINANRFHDNTEAGIVWVDNGLTKTKFRSTLQA